MHVLSEIVAFLCKECSITLPKISIKGSFHGQDIEDINAVQKVQYAEFISLKQRTIDFQRDF